MIVLLLGLSLTSMAENVSAIERSEANISLPLCVDQPIEVDAIKAIIKANPRNDHKYDGYKKALSGDTDAVLMARLVYAETLAANCSSQNASLTERIAEVLSNRVKKRGHVRSVIFQRDQFASSLNIYQNSRYLDLLCPKDLELWKMALAKTQALLNSSNSTNTLSAETMNYFLYKHDERWVRDPWNYEEDSAHTTPQLQQCIRTFKVPHWR